MSCGVGHRHDLDLALLWPWCRPAAIAPVRPIGWETLYASGAALKSGKKKKKETGNFQSVCRFCAVNLENCLVGFASPAQLFPQPWTDHPKGTELLIFAGMLDCFNFHLLIQGSCLCSETGDFVGVSPPPYLKNKLGE